MENGYITAGFAWRPGSQIDVKRVELLICRAEDIYQDHFDNDDVTVENLKYSTYNLEQWNSEGGSFCVCPALKPGVYHFVFRIDNGEQRELTISDYYDRTFLGNGRAVNYIEVLANNKKNLTRGKYGLNTSYTSKGLVLALKFIAFDVRRTLRNLWGSCCRWDTCACQA